MATKSTTDSSMRRYIKRNVYDGGKIALHRNTQSLKQTGCYIRKRTSLVNKGQNMLHMWSLGNVRLHHLVTIQY